MTIDNNIFFALAEEQLNAGEQVRITLVGTSMLPTLCEGDVLTLAPITHSPAVGDVVLFRYNDKHLLHRIIAVDGVKYTMQGDACSCTESCRKTDIVGLLVDVERHNKIKHFILRCLGRKGCRLLRTAILCLQSIRRRPQTLR